MDVRLRDAVRLGFRHATLAWSGLSASTAQPGLSDRFNADVLDRRWHPPYGEDAEMLVQHADVAMYLASVQHLAADDGDLHIVRSTIELAPVPASAWSRRGRRSFALLRELGCDLAQGFHLGRPVPAETLLDQLEERGITPRSRRKACSRRAFRGTGETPE
jgi:hypothetical protein